MKKIIFLIIGIALSLYTMGQIPKSKVVDARVPDGAKQLTKEELTTYLHNNYKKSGIPLDKENTYQLDGLLISFWDLSVNPEFKKSLQASQSELLEYLKLNNENVINYSKIITVNDVQFLVCEYQKHDEVYLWFVSDYNKKNKKINGVIQFKEVDEAKAQKALNDLLQTVHFKE